MYVGEVLSNRGDSGSLLDSFLLLWKAKDDGEDNVYVGPGKPSLEGINVGSQISHLFDCLNTTRYLI